MAITLGDSGSDLNLVFLQASSNTSSGRGALSRSCRVGAEVQVPASVSVGTGVRAASPCCRWECGSRGYQLAGRGRDALFLRPV